MKKTITIMLLLAMLGAIAMPTQAEAKTFSSCAKAERTIKQTYGYGKVKFLRNHGYNDRTIWRQLSHRKGKRYTYVEVIDGRVLNRKGDGRDSSGYYINYHRVKGARKGSRVRTYLVFCRDCNESDDVIARHDVVIRR